MDRIRNYDIWEPLRYSKELPTTIYFGKRIGSTRYPKILLEGHVEGNKPKGRPAKYGLRISNTSVRRMEYQ